MRKLFKSKGWCSVNAGRHGRTAGGFYRSKSIPDAREIARLDGIDKTSELEEEENNETD